MEVIVVRVTVDASVPRVVRRSSAVVLVEEGLCVAYLADSIVRRVAVGKREGRRFAGTCAPALKDDALGAAGRRDDVRPHQPEIGIAVGVVLIVVGFVTIRARDGESCVATPRFVIVHLCGNIAAGNTMTRLTQDLSNHLVGETLAGSRMHRVAVRAGIMLRDEHEHGGGAETSGGIGMDQHQGQRRPDGRDSYRSRSFHCATAPVKRSILRVL